MLFKRIKKFTVNETLTAVLREEDCLEDSKNCFLFTAFSESFKYLFSNQRREKFGKLRKLQPIIRSGSQVKIKALTAPFKVSAYIGCGNDPTKL